MTAKTSIEWTGPGGVSWNPIRGCSRVSAGCDHCYAEGIAARFSGPGLAYAGLAKMVHGKPHWTGKITVVEKDLEAPLHWRKPRKVFVCSMGDLFNEGVPTDVIVRVYAVMAACPQHTFINLTKRPERRREFLNTPMIGAKIDGFDPRGIGGLYFPPLPNVWELVSVEDQATADARIPVLLDTPAAVRGISLEPMLGAVDLTRIKWPAWKDATMDVLRGGTWDAGMGFTNLSTPKGNMAHLDWVIVGGESGPGARPMHPDWVRAVRDQCTAAGVPLFFKQWGEFLPQGQGPARRPLPATSRQHDWGHDFSDGSAGVAYRVGKQRAGRVLDGRTWDEFPGASSGAPGAARGERC